MRTRIFLPILMTMFIAGGTVLAVDSMAAADKTPAAKTTDCAPAAKGDCAGAKTAKGDCAGAKTAKGSKDCAPAPKGDKNTGCAPTGGN